MVWDKIKSKILTILNLRLTSKNYFDDKISIVFSILLGFFPGAFLYSLFDVIGIGLTELYFPFREPFDIITIVLTGLLFPLTLSSYIIILKKSDGLTVLNRVITAVLVCIFSCVLGIIVYHLWWILMMLLEVIKSVFESLYWFVMLLYEFAKYIFSTN